MRRKQRPEFGLPIGQVAGFALLFAALLVSFVLFPGIVQPVLGVLVAAAGAGKAVMELFEGPPNEELPPASRRFRQLADPARPIVAGDPVSAAQEQLSVGASEQRDSTRDAAE